MPIHLLMISCCCQSHPMPLDFIKWQYIYLWYLVAVVNPTLCGPCFLSADKVEIEWIWPPELRSRVHILLLSLCLAKSLTCLLSWFLTIWTIFWKIFKKFSGKHQEFCEKSQIFTFFLQKMRRTFHAVSMQFICGFYAVSKLHINCMQFLCGLRQTAYSLAQTAYSLYAVFMQFGNRIKTAYKLHRNCVESAPHFLEKKSENLWFFTKFLVFPWNFRKIFSKNCPDGQKSRQ